MDKVIKEDIHLTTLRVPRGLHMELKVLCAQNRLTVNEVIIESIRFAIEKIRRSEFVSEVPCNCPEGHREVSH
jgi:hypothetical protein